MTELQGGVHRLLALRPADAYVYGHFGSYEAQVESLQQRGLTVYRYLNTHDVYEQARQWEPRYEWGRVMIDMIDRFGLALTSNGRPEGPPLHFRWFGQGLILRWDLVTPGSAAMDSLVDGRGFLASLPGPLFIDQAWTYIATWMLLEGVENGGPIDQAALDTLYSQPAYAANYREFLRRLAENAGGGEPEFRLVVVNGQNNWDLLDGRLQMYENANLGFFYPDWPGVLQRWRDRPGSMLELDDRQPGEDPSVWAKAVEAVDVWIQNGGLLVANGTGVPAYALAMRRTACVDSSTGVVYLGGFSAAGIDTTGNGLFDVLSVALDIVTTKDALVLASAELFDAGGRFVAGGTGTLSTQRGVPGSLALLFDGRLVFGNLRDGPYAVRNVRFFAAGADPVVLADAGTTQAYAFTSFEPAAVVTGTVELEPGVPAVGAEVRSEWAVDYVDAEGRYRLVHLQDRTVVVRAHHDSIAAWSIVLNGGEIGSGDSVIVPVAIGRIDRVDFLDAATTGLSDPETGATAAGGAVLHQSIPNPWRARAQIPFTLAQPGRVRLVIYDAAGRRLRTLLDGWTPRGGARARWDGLDDHGRAAPSGTYFCQLTAGGRSTVRRITLVR
jgi:hypothetical protein